MGGLPPGKATLVFTGIEGSTRLFHALGPRLAAPLDEHIRLRRAAITTHDGVEVTSPGRVIAPSDGIDPRRTEDSP